MVSRVRKDMLGHFALKYRVNIKNIGESNKKKIISQITDSKSKWDFAPGLLSREIYFCIDHTSQHTLFVQ